jgi:hypothetical protein
VSTSTQQYVGERFIPRRRLQFLNTQAAEADKPFTFTQALCDAGFDPSQWLACGLVKKVGPAADPLPVTPTTASPTASGGDAKAAPARDAGHGVGRLGTGVTSGTDAADGKV